MTDVLDRTPNVPLHSAEATAGIRPSEGILKTALFAAPQILKLESAL